MNYNSIRIYNEKNSIWPHILTVEHYEHMYEIAIVREGHIEYSIQGEQYVVSKDQMIFINADVLHHRIDSANDKEVTDAKFDILLIAPETIFPGDLENYYREISGEGAIPFLLFSRGATRHREIIEMFDRAIDIYKREEDGYELDLLSEIFGASNRLVSYIKKVPGRLDEVYQEPAVMKKMIGFIQDNYKRKLTLKEIGEAADICRSRCCSFFKAYMKESANDYLAYYRLSKSVELFEREEMSFVKIAAECGFGGASYYSEMFKKVVGCTPSEYKERLNVI